MNLLIIFSTLLMFHKKIETDLFASKISYVVILNIIDKYILLIVL